MRISCVHPGRKGKIMLKRILVLVLFVLALSSCSKSASSTDPTATGTASTSVAFPSLAALTPTVSTNPTPYAPFTVKSGVDNLNVRMSPGYLFDVLMVVQPTDALSVLGKAPGGEWINVKTADGVEGWVFAELLKSDVDLEQVSVSEPKDVLLIKGRVLDAAGTPIQGVGFDVKQGTEADALTNAVVTDANGEFFSFLPTTSSGAWTVTYTATACKSNVWSDSACSNYKAGYTGNVTPQTLTVNLPQGSPLAFTWK
jgi:uncharacterized protein YgiM (DUF1202 family)